MIELIMLGTGSAFSKKYYNNNALFHLNGYRLLIDCGHTVHRSMNELGMSWEKDIDGVLITHLHADHIGGLEEIALDGKYKFRKTVDLFVPQSLKAQLWDNCLKGGAGDPVYDRLEDFFRVREIGEDVFPIGGFDLNMIKTAHIPGKDSFSLRIGDLFYSADLQFDASLLLSLPDSITHIFHECSWLPSPVHTSLDQILTLPEHLQAKTWLMHYSDNLPDEMLLLPSGKLNVLEQHKRYLLQR